MPNKPRDYSLTGINAQNAIDAGLATAEWYHTDIPRKDMKALMKRSDRPAVRDTIIWVGALIVSGTGGAHFWGTWWCVPFFFIYGTLYGSASDSRWHETGHGTAFRTAWMNNVVYHIASFMLMWNPVRWRWSHARHHTDTLIVGRDAEIAVMRPADFAFLISNLLGLTAWRSLRDLLLNAAGRLTTDESDLVPGSEHRKAILAARIHVVIYAATIGLAFVGQTWLPLMLIGLPRVYGRWHAVMTGLLQHGGLAENVTDHRLNTRTVYMNPISRFIYWNMNYHVEHHMFPMVPYHALPKLHEMIKHDLPTANPSIWQAYREMIPVLWKQLRHEDAYLHRALPSTARPYRGELHDNAPAIYT